jgi:hypothetical protein
VNKSGFFEFIMGSYSQMNSYKQDPYRCPDKVHLSSKVEGFSTLVYCDEKYSQLKSVNI